MDKFTEAYIECALWSSMDDLDEPLDKNYGPDDIAPEALARIEADCTKFQEENKVALSCYEHPLYSADALGGHDFWLSRNGHGSGFFDRTDRLPKEVCDRLQEAACKFRECDLYVGDDGLIYLA